MTATLDISPADQAEVERIVLASGTSFYRGMRSLPRARRTAIYGIYAFCRIVDDIADDPAPLPQKHRQLAQWRGLIADLKHGKADMPVTRVLLAAQRQFGLREDDFLAVIDGMQSDADQIIVAPSDADLDLYCDRVASAVGRLSVRAFGDASADADLVAHHLGRALQLTNILRDIAEDAARGRIYLSSDVLMQSGIAPDPAMIVDDPRLPQACAVIAARAHGHFTEAAQAMRRCRRGAMRPARLMAAGYFAILTALERRGWDRPREKIKISVWRKLWIALRYRF